MNLEIIQMQTICKKNNNQKFISRSECQSNEEELAEDSQRIADEDQKDSLEDREKASCGQSKEIEDKCRTNPRTLNRQCKRRLLPLHSIPTSVFVFFSAVWRAEIPTFAYQGADTV